VSQRKSHLIRQGHNRKDGSIKHTLTSTFLLPTVGVNLNNFGRSFTNAYISEENGISIYVVCNNNEHDSELLTSLVRCQINPNFFDKEDIEDEIIIKFKIPEEYHEVYNLFIEGSYSKFPEHYKKILVGIYGHETIQNSYIVSEYNVLYPQDYKRKQIAKRLSTPKSEVDYKLIKEVIDSPDLSYEVYKDIREISREYATNDSK